MALRDVVSHVHPIHWLICAQVARLAGRPDLEALALRSWRALARATGRVKGLAPSKLKMTSSGCAAQFVFGDQAKLTVGSGVDSYYEYLLKGWLQ